MKVKVDGMIVRLLFVPSTEEGFSNIGDEKLVNKISIMITDRFDIIGILYEDRLEYDLSWLDKDIFEDKAEFACIIAYLETLVESFETVEFSDYINEEPFRKLTVHSRRGISVPEGLRLPSYGTIVSATTSIGDDYVWFPTEKAARSYANCDRDCSIKVLGPDFIE
jgi:hypothetical protein